MTKFDLVEALRSKRVGVAHAPTLASEVEGSRKVFEYYMPLLMENASDAAASFGRGHAQLHVKVPIEAKLSDNTFETVSNYLQSQGASIREPLEVKDQFLYQINYELAE